MKMNVEMNFKNYFLKLIKSDMIKFLMNFYLYDNNKMLFIMIRKTIFYFVNLEIFIEECQVVH